MKKSKLLNALVAGILFISASAQNVPPVRNCGTMDHLQMLIKNDPQVELNMQTIEQQVQTFIQNNSQMKMAGTVITIPVVVHVVYNTSAQNISDAQVKSQIDALNEDYRKLNADASTVPTAFKSLAADASIEFCLAQRDPNGNATTGIIHKQTTTTSFSDDDRVKSSSTGGDNTWDASKYLNLWSCNLGGGLLGYAQFPGGPASTDGVVILYSSFGRGGSAVAPYDRGRTVTHEVGHWLNLRHIWGDANCGNDLVNDTPTQQTSNFGCPSFPHVTCSNGANGDMFMNYMDYTDDACMFMFSAGQVSRITATINGTRLSLQSSLGCTPPSTGSCGTAAGLSAANITSTAAVLNWNAVAGATSYTILYNVVGSSAQTSITVSGTSTSVSGLKASTNYEFRVTAVCTSATGNVSAPTTFTTTATTGTCSDAFEPNETTTAAKAIGANSINVALIKTSTDVDYFKITTTSGARNIKVTLTNLPADFDLQLFNPLGTLLRTSQNGSTTNEAVTYNNGVAGTYYIRVYGFNGAKSNTCYTLTVTTSGTSFINAVASTNTNKLAETENVEQAYSIFPNPASNELHVGYTSAEAQKISIQVIDQLGRSVIQYEQNASPGYNEFQYNTGDLSGGIYFVRLQAGENVELKKLVIRKE